MCGSSSFFSLQYWIEVHTIIEKGGDSMAIPRDIDELRRLYIGYKSNMLTIIDVVKEAIPGNDGDRFEHFLAKCQCECGNVVIYRLGFVINGSYKSCGCLRRNSSKINIIKAQEARMGAQRLNRFSILNPFTVEVYTLGVHGDRFWTDIFTWNWMKRFTWQMNTSGYPTTQLGGYGFQYHKIILCSPPGYEIDHITRVKADCRYFNLRVISHKENMWNYGARDNTKSSLRGVYQNKNKWMAYIVTKDGQKLDQACNSREEALALRKYVLGGDLSCNGTYRNTTFDTS